MQGDDRRRWLGLLLAACLFVPTTLFLLHAQSGQRVDAQNRSLKAPDSDDQRNLETLATVVPGDAVLLLAFAVPGDLPILPEDHAALRSCQERIAALPGVVAVSTPPSPEPALSLLTVSLRGDDSGPLAEEVVRTARAEAPTSLRVLATGLPLIEGRIASLVAGERARIVPWLVLALFVAASAVYRHFGLGLAALLPALCAIAWTGGLVALLGHPLDPIGALLDPVLLTIGVAASVHYVEAFRRGRRDGLGPVAACTFASKSQHQPAFLATATTMVGLLALCTSTIPAVVDFGVRAALGVALVHLFTFVLLPAWLPFAARGPITPANGTSIAAGWTARIHRWRAALLATTAAVTAFAVAALPHIRADNDPLTLLPLTDSCRIDHDQLAERLGGVEIFHLLVPERTAGTDPGKLLPFVAAMQTLPGMAGLAGPALRGSDGDLAVPLLLRPGGSSVRTSLFAEVDRAARVIGLDGLASAGMPVQIARDSSTLMQSLLGSLWLTLLLLFVGISMGLRSLRLGLLGMLPNLLPCLWIYGGIAWLDRPVSVATAMIGCTMLGLIVDNSLHLLHHYRLARRGMGRHEAVTEALHHCGRGICLASALLVVGFGVTAASHLATTVEFSLLACTTIAAGLFGAVVVLPLLLVRATAPAPRQAHAL